MSCRDTADSPRVTFINRFFWPDESATSQLLTDLAVHLASEGMEVEILTSRQLYTDARANLCPVEEFRDIHIQRLPSTAFGRSSLAGRFLDYLTFYLSLFLKLLFLRHPPSVVVAKTDPPMLSVLAAPICRLRGVELISWCQDLFPEIAFASGNDQKEPLASSLLRRIRNWSLKRCNAVVVLGRDMQNYLSHEVGNETRVLQIPNWSDGLSIWPVPRDKNDLRREWDLQDRFVVGYSGNLGRVHDYKTLLEAARILGPDSNITFLFIGSGALLERMQAEVPPDLQKIFCFQPYQPRSQLHLSLSVPDAHWVSLNPAFRNYVFPSKLYGVFAAGRPVIFIGDSDSELARMLDKQEIGFAADIGDARTVAQQIMTLKESPTRCEEMGERARNTFDREWAMEQAMQKWSELIRTTCRKEGPRPPHHNLVRT